MNLVTHLRGYVPEILQLLEESVNIDSPSHHKALCDNMADWYTTQFTKLCGGVVERFKSTTHGDRLLCKIGSGSKRILLLGHYDTVWPEGEALRRPFRIEGNQAFGPGVYDMKAGILHGIFAIKTLIELNRFPMDTEVLLFLNSDEEIGSITSRPLIEEVASSCDAVLVLEPPMAPTGALKTWRKGSGRYTLKVEGRASHAGVAPQSGVSAIRELAYQIGKLYELADEKQETTINVGIIQGGIGVNVIAPYAEAQIDLRVKTIAEANRIEKALRDLTSNHADAKLDVNGRFLRPPMERTEETARLFHLAKEVALQEIGEELQEIGTGGVSDGNFCAALGIPTLDGLGARGDHAHSPDEFIWIDEIPKRAAILAGLIEKI